MSFSADWLALRRDADFRARNRDLAGRLAAHFRGREKITVLDLGSGTGANLHATAPLLPPRQHWRCVDHDPALLARIVPPNGITLETRTADLSDGILLDPIPDLVTASAFFDLAGADWLDRFAREIARAGAVFYTVLSYDGREDWAGDHPSDAEVLAAFHADQRTDKGLGPALGPDAHAHLAARLRQEGLTVHEGASDWTLEEPRDAALIAALAEGTARAVEPALGPRAGAWLGARRTADRVMIGHRDLLALPVS